MAHLDALEHVAREARERQRTLGGKDISKLRPRGLHELVLVLTHDFGTPARGEPVARLKRDAFEPARVDLRLVNGVLPRGELAVDRWPERRHRRAPGRSSRCPRRAAIENLL